MYDARTHKVRRIRVDFLQERRAKADNLGRKGRNRSPWHRRQQRGASSKRSTHQSPQRARPRPEPGNVHRQTGTLALVTSVSIGCLALKMLCTSCWGLWRQSSHSVSWLQPGPRPPVHLQTSCHSLAQLLPALEEILRSHFRGLEKLVECDWQLHRHILKGSPVPVSNTEVHWEESTMRRKPETRPGQGPECETPEHRRAARGPKKTVHLQHTVIESRGRWETHPQPMLPDWSQRPGTVATSSRSPAVQVSLNCVGSSFFP